MAADAAIFLFALRERNLTKFDVVAVRDSNRKGNNIQFDVFIAKTLKTYCCFCLCQQVNNCRF